MATPRISSPYGPSWPVGKHIASLLPRKCCRFSAGRMRRSQPKTRLGRNSPCADLADRDQPSARRRIGLRFRQPAHRGPAPDHRVAHPQAMRLVVRSPTRCGRVRQRLGGVDQVRVERGEPLLHDPRSSSSATRSASGTMRSSSANGATKLRRRLGDVAVSSRDRGRSRGPAPGHRSPCRTPPRNARYPHPGSRCSVRRMDLPPRGRGCLPPFHPSRARS
jgi:hypothetical protein